MTLLAGSLPHISVVIPTRNRHVMLAEAIASVRAQAGVSREILVVDDASDDDTWSWLETKAGLRCFRQQPHGGRSRARNLGLAEVRGRYVMFLDDDDLLRPGALAALARGLREHPDAVASVGARWDWFVAEGWGLRDMHPFRALKCDIFDELLFGWSAVSGQVLYRTAVVRRVGGYDEALEFVEDRDLWLRIARQGSVVLRPESTLTYRVHAGQTRPPDIRRMREQIAQRAIRSLPRAERWHGLILRCSSGLVQKAEDRMREGHPVESLLLAARAVALAPRLFLSPLIGTWVARRLAGSAWHRLRRR